LTDPNAIPQLRDDVRFREIDNEAVIVCQTSGAILAVNEIGARVLSAAESGLSVDALIDDLEKKYDVTVEALKSDVSKFIGELSEAGVLKT